MFVFLRAYAIPVPEQLLMAVRIKQKLIRRTLKVPANINWRHNRFVLRCVDDIEISNPYPIERFFRFRISN